jgi:GDPmannose 4,6-dehydratase
MKTAIIFGVTGQDGSYLSEHLLGLGYRVHGVKRRVSNFNTERVDHLLTNPHFQLWYGDVCDAMWVAKFVNQIQAEEIYNLAAQSHVAVSFEVPNYTSDATGQGALNIFEAVKHFSPHSRVYQASSSEQFGNEPAPQNEKTPFRPRSPYGCAKTFAHNCAVNYREAHGLFIACGILFNHESTRRNETFVTRKIACAAARIACGLQDKLVLGNMDAKRDWGFAGEYVQAMHLMLQHSVADDFVIGSGVSVTVGAFCDFAFQALRMKWQDYVVTDARYFRPSEVDNLRADSSKAREVLGWCPQIGVDQLALGMVEAEVQILSTGTSQDGQMRDLKKKSDGEGGRV